MYRMYIYLHRVLYFSRSECVHIFVHIHIVHTYVYRILYGTLTVLMASSLRGNKTKWAETREGWDTCLCSFGSIATESIYSIYRTKWAETLKKWRNFDRKNPPPRGGFLFTMFPHQEPCVRGPPSKDLYQVLRGGSSYTRFLMMEHSK